jgi:hypothetical protein
MKPGYRGKGKRERGGRIKIVRGGVIDHRNKENGQRWRE